MINYYKKKELNMNKKTRKIIAWIMLVLMVGSVITAMLAYVL